MDESNYNMLYVGFGKSNDGHQYVFTQIGNDSLKSQSYRDDKWDEWFGRVKDTSRGFAIKRKNKDDAKHLQRTFHEVFKPWYVEGGSLDLPRPMTDDCYKHIFKRLIESFDSPDRHAVRLDIMQRLKRCLPIKEESGYIYLFKFRGVYKIGYSVDWERRKSEIEDRYGAVVKVLNVKRTDNMKWDEAVLHMLCSAYKSEDNKLGKQKEDENFCSELYRQDPAVLQIWRDYWKKNMKLEII